MPLSTDVNLPRTHRAEYPERCVRCGDDPKGKTIRIWTHTIGWWTYLLWAFGKGFTTHPPVCGACGLRFRAQRWGRFFGPAGNRVARTGIHLAFVGPKSIS